MGGNGPWNETAHGSMRNMTLRNPRGGEMPALPESEPLHHSPPSMQRRWGLNRGNTMSDPSLETANDRAQNSSDSGSPPSPFEALSTSQVAARASSHERTRSLEAAHVIEDPNSPSIANSRNSSFMSVASTADLHRESTSLCMSVKIAGAALSPSIQLLRTGVTGYIELVCLTDVFQWTGCPEGSCCPSPVFSYTGRLQLVDLMNTYNHTCTCLLSFSLLHLRAHRV